MKRSFLIALSCAALSGCAVQLYGNQSSTAGSTTTAAASHVVASGAAGNARVSFFSGQPVSSAAPGGQVRFNSGSAGVTAAFVAFAGILDYIGGAAAPKPLPPDTRISHTCSCYGYQPETGDQGLERDILKP